MPALVRDPGDLPLVFQTRTLEGVALESGSHSNSVVVPASPAGSKERCTPAQSPSHTTHPTPSWRGGAASTGRVRLTQPALQLQLWPFSPPMLELVWFLFPPAGGMDSSVPRGKTGSGCDLQPW